MIYSIGLDETSSTQIDDYIEEKVMEVLSQAINNEEWCEDNSIRQDIKLLGVKCLDIKKHLERHDDSLHNMYEAINAVSRMTGKQKMLLDTHEELIEDLKEKVENND
jgi:ribosomal protein S15P/S13E